MGLLVFVIVVAIGFVGFRLWQLRQEVTTYKYYWQQRAKQRQPAEILYIALGDSTAQGIGASHPELGYVGLIADRLSETTGKHVHVINLSVSGARVRDVIDNQLPRLAKLPVGPGVFVTLACGANDMSKIDERKFKQEMEVLLAHMPDQTVVADVAYFGAGRKRKLEQQVLTANKIIHRVADEEQLVLAELHKITSADKNILTNSVDLFHPSNRGYRNWYEAFRQAMGL